MNIMTNTQDLSQFGYTELSRAAKLLSAYCDQDHDFLYDGVAIELNPDSGCVFLIDEDYNVGMMNGDTLEAWLYCPTCGTEGFLDDMIDEGDDCCIEYLQESELIGENDLYRRRAKEGMTSSGSTRLTDIVGGVEDLIPSDLFEEFTMTSEDDPDDECERTGIFEEIIDHLQEIAPDGCVFGTYEGDGACYGFWKIGDEEA